MIKTPLPFAFLSSGLLSGHRSIGKAWLASFAVFLALVFFDPSRPQAQGLELIRDAEIEITLRRYADPIFQTAGLSPSSIRIFIVKDQALNAFVTNGQYMFIHTGLLTATKDPTEVIGVIAHEAGHIAAGHLSGRRSALNQAGVASVVTTILGLGAAVIAGDTRVGTAVALGGQELTVRNLLRYTRAQESAADQAAIRYLKANKISPAGLVTFSRRLEGQEALYTDNQDPYLRTHPLTRDRIDFFRRKTQESASSDKPTDPELIRLHQRMTAKLNGFLLHPIRVKQIYPSEDQSLPARYARAISYLRDHHLEEGLTAIESLLSDYPDDPFFLELRGQMLFEFGRVAEALPDYERAVSLLPNAISLRLALAQVQIERNDPQTDKAALENLAFILNKERHNSFAWRLTAIAHGRAGNDGMTALALGEADFAQGNFQEAALRAKRASDLLPKGSPAWLRAQDLADQSSYALSKKK